MKVGILLTFDAKEICIVLGSKPILSLLASQLLEYYVTENLDLRNSAS